MSKVQQSLYVGSIFLFFFSHTKWNKYHITFLNGLPYFIVSAKSWYLHSQMKTTRSTTTLPSEFRYSASLVFGLGILYLILGFLGLLFSILAIVFEPHVDFYYRIESAAILPLVLMGIWMEYKYGTCVSLNFIQVPNVTIIIWPNKSKYQLIFFSLKWNMDYSNSHCEWNKWDFGQSPMVYQLSDYCLPSHKEGLSTLLCSKPLFDFWAS